MKKTITLRVPRRIPSRLRTAQSVLVVILTLIFIATATRRIWEFRVVAEQTGVRHTIGALQSAIGMEVVRRVVRSGLSELPALERASPMDYLEPVPANYQRLEGKLAPQQLMPRHWYYEPEEGVLIYRVRYGDYLDTPLSGPPRIRWQLQMHYTDSNGNRRYDPASEHLERIALVPLEPYRWRQP